ncbi:MAG TPA: methyltransferase domain-containing protein [Acidimicrobiales bacterium]|nr:methyltransferase domain-containing protein [Acidimicrobiales bacterium]
MLRSGQALVEAAVALAAAGSAGPVRLVGVDLVDFFASVPPGLAGPELVVASVASWVPDTAFDLVTCVHGLHYVGDKLGLLSRAAGWLAPGGLLVADLDPGDVRLADGRPAGQRLPGALRAAGFAWDGRRRRVTRRGAGAAVVPWRYLGADDRGGPNRTGQPSVRSYYEVAV